jgi:Rap1a immunity proteins
MIAALNFVGGVVFAAANVCLPQGVTNNQVVAVVIKYIEARPERMHEQFGDLALEALTAAWPCKR